MKKTTLKTPWFQLKNSQVVSIIDFRQNEFIRSILADTLNKEEAMQTFELLDTNKDGNLTVKEISLLFGDDTKGNTKNSH